MCIKKYFVFLFITLILININICEPVENENEHDNSKNLNSEDLKKVRLEEEQRKAERIKVKVQDLFITMDKNQNNNIDRDELFRHIISAFKHLHKQNSENDFMLADTNKDNKVTQDEYFKFDFGHNTSVMENLVNIDFSKETLALKKKFLLQKKTFAAADDDQDGMLNPKEYIPFKYPIFFRHMADIYMPDFIEVVDRNGDGVINQQEYVDIFKIFDPHDEAKVKNSIEHAKNNFTKFDKDGNGIIDSVEYIDKLNPSYEEEANMETRFLFEETDTDKNGLLALQEILNIHYRWIKGILIFEEEEELMKEINARFGDEL